MSSVKGPEMLIVHEVGEFSAGLANGIVQNSPVVVTLVDLHWLHILIRRVS